MKQKPSITEIKKKTHSMIREVEVKYKTLNSEKISLNTPLLVAEFLEEKIGNECRETFAIICIDNKNMVVAYSVVSIGTVSEAIVHPREVFVTAIMTKASGVIICHNHPSGTITPSRQDIETTKRLYDAGKIIGIPVVDHIIVGFDTFNYYSMKENGYLN